MLARNLWLALIRGRELEEKTWKVVKTTGNSLQAIQQMYFDQMKPVVSEEQRVALRERYRVRRKDEGLT